MKFRWWLLVLWWAMIDAHAQTPPPPLFPSLLVSKSDSADPVLPNVEFDYVVQVLNIGTAAATNVVLHDRLPAGLTFVSASTVFGTASQSTTNVYFFIPSLADGAQATVTVRVKGAMSGLMTNTVSASAGNATNPVYDTETTYMLSDLRIALSDSADPVQRGDLFAYSLVFSNAGAVLMTNIVATNELPAQVDFVAATASAGSVTQSGARVVFALGDLAAGASATATVRVHAAQSGVATSRVQALGFVAGAPVAGLGTTSTRILGTVSDLNADGLGDLILQSKTGGVLYLQFMNGTEGTGGSFPLGEQDIRPWQWAATADLNRDGVPELIARNGGIHWIGVLSSGTVSGVVNLFMVKTDLSPWHVVAGGDLNSDGYGDLVFQRGDSGVYAVVLQKNNLWTAAQYLGGKPLDISPWRIMAAADTDGDGRSELVLREGGSSIYGLVKVNGWTVQSGGYLTGARTDVKPWNFRAATDLDGDGFDELVFQNGSSSQYAAAFMDGYIILKSPLLFTNGLDVSAWNVIGPN